MSRLLLVALAAAAACRGEVPLPRSDRPLALLERPTADGSILDVAPYQGRVVAVTFWSPG
jgi:hypothetical protein